MNKASIFPLDLRLSRQIQLLSGTLLTISFSIYSEFPLLYPIWENSLLCLPRSYRSDDSSIVRLRLYFGSNTSHVITNHSAHEVIHITDDSDSERFSRSSLDGGAFSSDSSCDASSLMIMQKVVVYSLSCPLHPKLQKNWLRLLCWY